MELSLIHILLLELGNEVGDHAARNLIDQRAGLGSENIGIEKAGIDALLLDLSLIHIYKIPCRLKNG